MIEGALYGIAHWLERLAHNRRSTIWDSSLARDPAFILGAYSENGRLIRFLAPTSSEETSRFVKSDASKMGTIGITWPSKWNKKPRKEIPHMADETWFVQLYSLDKCTRLYSSYFQ